MKTLQYITAIFLIAGLTGSARAVDTDQVLARRAQAATLPLSDSAILYHGTTITIHDDGRVDREEHIFRYLRDINSWDEYGDPHIGFDSQRQTLDVQIARTYTTDGRRVDSTPNAFNPIVPFGLDKAPDFTDYRQMVVTLLGIEKDAVTELKYVISDTEPLYPWAWGEFLFGSREPTLEREIIIRAPRNAGLKVIPENGAPAVKRSIGGDQEIVTFRMTDLPSINLADAADYTSRFLPRVCYSTCPSWDDFTTELNARFDEKALSANNNFLNALAAYKTINDDRTKLDSTVAFLKDRIALKNFPDIGMLLRFRSTDQIYNTGYANPADMAVIYTAALRAVGFDPKVYLLGTQSLSVPGITGKENYSLHIDMQPTPCRVDPSHGTVDYLPPEDVSYLGVFPAQAPKHLQPTPYSDSQTTIRLDLTFNDDGSAEGTILATTSGRMSLYKTATEEGAKVLVKRLTEILQPTPEIKNAVIQYADPMDVEVKADLSFKPADNLIAGLLPLVMPWKATDFEGFLPAGIKLYQPKRDVPVMMGCAGSTDVHITVHYPDGWKVAGIPKALKESTTGVSLARTVSQSKGTVDFQERIVVQKNRFSKESWDSWRRLFLKADDNNLRTLLLQTEI